MGGVAFSRPVAIHLGHWIRLLGWIPFVTALLLKYPRHTLAAIGEDNNANCAVNALLRACVRSCVSGRAQPPATVDSVCAATR